MSTDSPRTTSPKVVLVTGCASQESLGGAIALAFLDRGFRVFASCRAPVDRMAYLEERRCELLELDLNSDLSMRKAVDEIGKRTGRVLDVLVNNASLSSCTPNDICLLLPASL